MTTAWRRLIVVLLLATVVICSFTAGVLTGKQMESSRCLERVQEWSPPEQERALDLAEAALAAGGEGPESGTCEAERLDWLRENVQ